jgi:hypothetical protein
MVRSADFSRLKPPDDHPMLNVADASETPEGRPMREYTRTKPASGGAKPTEVGAPGIASKQKCPNSHARQRRAGMSAQGGRPWKTVAESQPALQGREQSAAGGAYRCGRRRG